MKQGGDSRERGAEPCYTPRAGKGGGGSRFTLSVVCKRDATKVKEPKEQFKLSCAYVALIFW